MIVTDKKILRKISSDWNGTIEELKEIVEKMYEAQVETGGVGISAIQVGLPFRIFLTGQGEDMEIFLNPKVKELSPYRKADWEGCLSCPDAMVRVKRASYIVIEYTTLREGRYMKVTRKLKDFDARVVQHELDHLNGFLITDRGKVYRP